MIKIALTVGYVLVVGALLLRSGSSLGLTLGYLLICLAIVAALSAAATFAKRRITH